MSINQIALVSLTNQILPSIWQQKPQQYRNNKFRVCCCCHQQTVVPEFMPIVT